MFGIASLRLAPSAITFSKCLVQLRFNRYAVSLIHKDISKLKEKRRLNIIHDKDLKSIETFRDFSVRNVCFSYQNAKVPALNEVSLSFNFGESIGLIGPSGSGKTTLVDVLLGLLDPQKGEMLFNGIPLYKSLSKWRANS